MHFSGIYQVLFHVYIVTILVSYKCEMYTNNRDPNIQSCTKCLFQGCYPYEVQACDHHVVGTLAPCKGIGPTPKCKNSCEQGYNVSYNDDKHYGRCINLFAFHSFQYYQSICKLFPFLIRILEYYVSHHCFKLLNNKNKRAVDTH